MMKFWSDPTHTPPIDMGKSPSRKRATILQAMGGYVNTAIVIIQGLLLVPLYLHYIGAHVYGLWLASGGMLGVLGVVNFGVGSMVIQRVAKAYGNNNRAQAGTYFVNGAVVYFVICLFYVLVGYLASFFLPEILNISGNDAELLKQCFLLAVAAMAIGIFNECLRGWGQALLRPVFPAVSIAVGRLFGIGIIVWMLFDGFGLWAIPTGLLLAEILIFLLNMFNAVQLFRGLKIRIGLDLDIIKEYMRTSPALMMARVGNTLSREADPLLITMLLSPEVTTAYMITRRAADVVFRMLNVITGSIMGSFAHLNGCGDKKQTSAIAQKLLTLNFSMGIIGFATYVGANHSFVSLWVGESFVLDQNIILFVGLAYGARTFRGLLGQLLFGVGDFVYPSVVILLEGVGRVALTLGLLSVLGIIGVPLAFMLSCLVMIALLSFRLKLMLAMRFYVPAIVKFLFTAAVLFVISHNLSKINIAISSWNIFVIYLVVLLVVSIGIFLSMNFKRCRDIYRSIAI